MKKNFLTDDSILHLAQLAKLKLNKEEIKRYKKQLEETLDYVKNLNELDTKKIDSIFNFVYLKNSYFKDGQENKRCLNKKQLTKNLKADENNYFEVERIL